MSTLRKIRRKRAKFLLTTKEQNDKQRKYVRWALLNGKTFLGKSRNAKLNKVKMQEIRFHVCKTESKEILK